MSYDALLIHTVTIRNLVNPSTTSDRYGNDTYTTTDVSEKARIQQLSADEILADRNTRVSSHRIFLKSNSAITVFSTVLWNGRTFDVTGVPNVVDGRTGPHHIEATLTEREG
jgi:head-tail adaptor